MRLRSFKTRSWRAPVRFSQRSLQPTPRKPPGPVVSTPVNFAPGISTLINRYLLARSLRTFISPGSDAFSAAPSLHTKSTTDLASPKRLLARINLPIPFAFFFLLFAFPPLSERGLSERSRGFLVCFPLVLNNIIVCLNNNALRIRISIIKLIL